MLLVLVAAVAAQAQNYTKIVVFGDSLSDTGNDFVLFTDIGFPFPAPYVLPPPYGYALNYTLTLFTDGSDTTPRAMNYFGVWIQQMAAALPAHPAVTASLWGGTNYAYGYSNTFSGQSELNIPDTPYTVYVDNVGQQIDDYLATHPKIDNHTLFVVWGGANNLTEAVGASDAAGQIVDGAITQVGNIQRLIHAGATQFLIPNLPDLGSIPRFNMSPTDSAAFHDASVLYNTTLDAGETLLPIFNFTRHLSIHKLDVYSLLKEVIASPTSYGLLNVTDSSQGTPVDPDTYLFWDDLHPTTHGHNLLGQAALETIEPRGCLVLVAPGEYVGSPAPGCR
ncbi:MAG TPA: SGNH/GDSL hydrolase family protein [Acidobacteriaceae bacterium]|nr:SGNH/GDSL hydrolase family protein [Acidobacteriaceae bacterium]